MSSTLRTSCRTITSAHRSDRRLLLTKTSVERSIRAEESSSSCCASTSNRRLSSQEEKAPSARTALFLGIAPLRMRGGDGMPDCLQASQLDVSVVDEKRAHARSVVRED